MARNRSLTMSITLSALLSMGCSFNNYGSVLPGVQTDIKADVQLHGDTKDIANLVSTPRPGETSIATSSPVATDSPTAPPSTTGGGLTQEQIDALAHALASAMPTTAPTATPSPTPDPTPTPTPVPTPTPPIRSFIRVIDGVLETTGLGIFGSSPALAREQTIDKDGRLAVWFETASGSGAFTLVVNQDDITLSTYQPRLDVKSRETFHKDVTGTASPSVQADVVTSSYTLDPAQNVHGLKSFHFPSGWKPTKAVADASAKSLAIGRKTVLLCTEGVQWFRWDNPLDPRREDFQGLAMQIVAAPVSSLEYLDASGSVPAYFTALTTTGKINLVGELFTLLVH